MSKHKIEVEGLPEGWELVSIKLPDNCTKQSGDTTISIHNVPGATFVLKKKQPRRIVLEETDEIRCASYGEYIERINEPGIGMWGDKYITSSEKFKIWREVKETEESKLCLSAEECEIILMTSVLPSGIYEKIILFLRNKNKTS